MREACLQGFGSFAFALYPGYMHGEPDFTSQSEDGGLIITSPNVKHVVREHFQCMEMEGAEMEDDGVAGTVNSHWEERIFQVRKRRACRATCMATNRFGTPMPLGSGAAGCWQETCTRSLRTERSRLCLLRQLFA